MNLKNNLLLKNVNYYLNLQQIIMTFVGEGSCLEVDGS